MIDGYDVKHTEREEFAI